MTAYEMRISDGSSDVCSSDLALQPSSPSISPATATCAASKSFPSPRSIWPNWRPADDHRHARQAHQIGRLFHRQRRHRRPRGRGGDEAGTRTRAISDQDDSEREIRPETDPRRARSERPRAGEEVVYTAKAMWGQ